MIELITEDSNLLIIINTHECSTKPGLHLHILMDFMQRVHTHVRWQ